MTLAVAFLTKEPILPMPSSKASVDAKPEEGGNQEEKILQHEQWYESLHWPAPRRVPVPHMDICGIMQVIEISDQSRRKKTQVSAIAIETLTLSPCVLELEGFEVGPPAACPKVWSVNRSA
ncbi:hypothetical protein FBEOM_12702 [Fusarium beomiforme]|uniref:Uncharacterized protein n=1 Tax=Fusarium beomiforme TaxID=44412 RepID=A0A9P5A7N5_9HYPO|nr:hypothetical protein FBEOM_12702 [Fusarium beomiforme]